jgi:hypothetical protein
MGLKGYRLWAMGQFDSNMQSPTASEALAKRRRARNPREKARANQPRCSAAGCVRT